MNTVYDISLHDIFAKSSISICVTSLCLCFPCSSVMLVLFFFKIYFCIFLLFIIELERGDVWEERMYGKRGCMGDRRGRIQTCVTATRTEPLVGALPCAPNQFYIQPLGTCPYLLTFYIAHSCTCCLLQIE